MLSLQGSSTKVPGKICHFGGDGDTLQILQHDGRSSIGKVDVSMGTCLEFLEL